VLAVNDNITMNLEHLKKQEEENLISLRKLISITDPLSIPLNSQLDPYRSIRKSVTVLRGQIKYLIEKYVVYLKSLNGYEVEGAVLEVWLCSMNTLGIFNNVLQESIPLILDTNLSIFREGLNLNFTTYILKIYSQLLFYKGLLTGQLEIELETVLENFENCFKRIYMIENYGITVYDEVRDLLSKNHNLVASLKIRNEDIVRKGYFRMTMNTLYKFSQLVELYQLKNGHIAIFKVKSNELPTSIRTPKQFMQRLVQGEYQLLHLGNSLLFPIIRQYDLKMVQELQCGYELKTTTGNGVELRLTSVDPIQWDTHWKLCFQKLFNTDGNVVSPFKADIDRAVRKLSSTSLNFLEKCEKLKNNPFIDDEKVTGLGIEFTNFTETPVKKVPKNDNISRKSSGFSLHKSNPLPKSIDLNAIVNPPLSTNPFIEPVIKKQQVQQNGGSSTIARNLKESPLGPHHTPKECLSIPSNVRQQKEDLILDDSPSQHVSSGNKNLVENSSVNNSEEFLCPKPTHDNEITDQPSEYGNTLQDKNPSNSSAIVPENSHQYNLPSSTSKTDLFEEYLHIFVNSSYLPIFEDPNSKISFWNGTTWEMPDTDEKMQLTIISVDNNSPLLFYHNGMDIHSCTFALLLTTKCKAGRATAQDIQIRFQNSSVLCGSIKNSTVMNIRTPQADVLLRLIQDCIYDKAIISQDSRSDINTSTSSKSQNNELSLENGRVLISNIKVKLHILKDSRWYPTSIGRITIIDQTHKDGATLIFMFIDNNKRQNKFSSLQYNIGRLGNTGISLTNTQEGRLFEFTNQNVANEIYNLII